MPPPDMSIFKAYDIRGVYPNEFQEDIARNIGRAFAVEAGGAGLDRCGGRGITFEHCVQRRHAGDHFRMTHGHVERDHRPHRMTDDQRRFGQNGQGRLGVVGQRHRHGRPGAFAMARQVGRGHPVAAGQGVDLPVPGLGAQADTMQE